VRLSDPVLFSGSTADRNQDLLLRRGWPAGLIVARRRGRGNEIKALIGGLEFEGCRLLFVGEDFARADASSALQPS
jgi:hypothetical protein